MIDFHCHLDLYPKPSAVIREIAKRGTFVLAVTTTPKAWEGNIRLVGDEKRIRVAVGLHPELVAERHDEVDLACSLISKAKYVGEIGIDGSPQYAASLGLQQEVFGTLLRSCVRSGGRIISIHSRLAATPVLDEIERHQGYGSAILHWFSGSSAELDRANSLGCWFSVGPAMLASKKGRGLLAAMPRDRILTETDGPFGMVDGRPLMPWDSEKSHHQIAKVFEDTEDGVTALVLANFRRLVSQETISTQPQSSAKA